MIHVSIIIPNLNGEKFLPNCLESLLKSIQKAKDIGAFEITLVDNASTDKSCKIFSNFCTKNQIKFQTINLDRNYGFAGAINKGIEASKSEWVLLCNNDLKIDENWLPLITKAILENSSSQLAAVTGTVLSYGGTKIESQGLKFYYSGKCDNLSNGKAFTPKLKRQLLSQKPHFIWGASAALTIYNRQILEKIGKFDDDFFAYEEDVDLALRLHNLGYKTLYVASALCYHLGGATGNQMGNFRYKMDAKNWFYIIIKNYSRREILKNLFPVIEQRLRNLSGLIKNTPFKQLFSTITDTYKTIFVKFSSMIQKRKQINGLKSN